MDAAKQAIDDEPAAFAAMAKAVADFEAHFTVTHLYEWKEPKAARTPTGELYHEYRHGPCSDYNGVVASWVATAEAARRAAPEQSTLYWRVKPEISYWGGNFGVTRGWWIYSRFIISSKPRKD